MTGENGQLPEMAAGRPPDGRRAGPRGRGPAHKSTTTDDTRTVAPDSVKKRELFEQAERNSWDGPG